MACSTKACPPKVTGKSEGGLNQPPPSRFSEFHLEIYFMVNDELSHRPETSAGACGSNRAESNIGTVALIDNR